MSRFVRTNFILCAFFLASVVRAEWNEGDPVPELSDFGLVGELPSFEGKVTYVDFWASWCPPCKASFPAMERLYTELNEEGFQIVAVSLDSSESSMNRFLDRTEPSFATVWDESQSLAAAAGIEVMPTSFLIDGTGKIRKIHLGWRGEQTEIELREEIQSLLKDL